MNDRTYLTPLSSMLEALPFLSSLHLSQLQALANHASKVEFIPDQVIFRERDPAHHFYVIIDGSVALESVLKDGRIVRIQTLSEGEILGWSWMFPPHRFHFSARALSSVNALFFNGTQLLEHCEKDPELGYDLVMRMSEIMVERLQFTRRQLVEVAKLAGQKAA